jgi:hypothetical protein
MHSTPDKTVLPGSMQKVMPLRKGKLAASGKRPGGGAAGVVADATARDPGMVLPVGIPSAPAAASGEGPASPATAATSPTSATATGAAGGAVDLLGFGDLTLQVCGR